MDRRGDPGRLGGRLRGAGRAHVPEARRGLSRRSDVTQCTTDIPDDVPLAPDRWRAGWLFAAIWLVYLAEPLSQMFDKKHSAVSIAAALVFTVVFSLAYIAVNLLVRREADTLPQDKLGDPRKLVLIGVLAAIAATLPPTVDGEWVVLWIYVASASGAVLPLGRPPSWAMRAGLVATAAMAIEASALDVNAGLWASLLLPCLFSCLGVIAVRGMRELIRQLRQARAEVARLAASEERLRMA